MMDEKRGRPYWLVIVFLVSIIFLVILCAVVVLYFAVAVESRYVMEAYGWMS
jgi:hypothetical protein